MHIDPDIFDMVVEVRRHLHHFPELSNEESGTKRFLLDRLKVAGIWDARPAAGYGLLVDVCAEAAPVTSGLCLH
ncbi:amidohydrolase [Mesorhizobium hawassense]|uniref:amidohydrolase n=1 Tax=Mesorhizobium hawassense TaxID=1209954 RepID=UPI00142DE83D|nr:amidohydrolase [Mesorhizobium hawassense]